MDPNYGTCQKDGKYTFYPFKGMPNEQQLKDMCASKACQALLKRIAAANLPDCDIEYDGKTYNVKNTVNEYVQRCLPHA
ncbi:TPA: hypothetical protein N0F65_008816 [Lagenidium giganteum]|nr:TPA: hypothetical protein N0F65_008816 [Lagenidium giganteum]